MSEENGNMSRFGMMMSAQEDTKNSYDDILQETREQTQNSFTDRLQEKIENQSLLPTQKELKSGAMIKRIKMLEQEKVENDFIINALLKDLDSMGIDNDTVQKVISLMK